jgi:hypothetical protein
MHVALPGGTLYKDGPRKDVDSVLYSHKHRDNGNPYLLEQAIINGKLPAVTGWQNRKGRVMKINYNSKPVDLIFPEEEGEYELGEDGEL